MSVLHIKNIVLELSDAVFSVCLGGFYDILKIREKSFFMIFLAFQHSYRVRLNMLSQESFVSRLVRRVPSFS